MCGIMIADPFGYKKSASCGMHLVLELPRGFPRAQSSACLKTMCACSPRTLAEALERDSASAAHGVDRSRGASANPGKLTDKAMSLAARVGKARS
jgi:hypothetical protein